MSCKNIFKHEREIKKCSENTNTESITTEKKARRATPRWEDNDDGWIEERQKGAEENHNVMDVKEPEQILTKYKPH